MKSLYHLVNDFGKFILTIDKLQELIILRIDKSQFRLTNEIRKDGAMADKKEKKVREEKVTRGYNLSKDNLLALLDEAAERTKRSGGKTITASVVLDDIVKKWNKARGK